MQKSTATNEWKISEWKKLYICKKGVKVCGPEFICKTHDYSSVCALLVKKYNKYISK